MLRHAESLVSGTELRAEALVVGAGPLGIIVALELADRGHKVALVDSGDGLGSQLLGTSARQDRFHVDKQLAVRRGLGGSTAMWGGRCLPFDPIDFDSRPAVPDSPWPIDYADLQPYFGRACDWFVCGRPAFNVEDVPELAGRQLIPGFADGDVRSSDLERWSLPTRFGPEYRERLEQHPLIDLVLGLTCTELVQADDGSIDHVLLRTLDQKTLTGYAREYVVASGGLESTRLLLASRRRDSAGIGNHSDHLGRWYMAHVEGRVAELHLDTPPDATIYHHERDADGVYVRRRFTFSREYQQTHDLANAAIWIVNPSVADHRHGSGILSGVYLTLISPIGGKLLAEGIRRAQTKALRPTSVRAHLTNIVRDFVPALRFAVGFTYARFLRRGRKAPGFFVKSASNVYPLHYHGEHRPHRESRVTLSDEVDALGMPRLDVDLRFSDADVASVRVAFETLDAALRDAGVGRIEFLYEDVEASVWDYLEASAGYHQAGSTRMSEAPEDGVVTPDLAVHGVPNLAVASTSVLPTSSQANPTFMGGVLAVRLADRLAAALAVPERVGATSTGDETID